MTKIEGFEQRIIRSGITASDLDEYEKYLRRVHGNYNRLQHCYLTAAAFPTERTQQAVALIRWGLERYPDEGYSTYTCLSYIGHLYERSGDWQAAYSAYAQADATLGEGELDYRRILAGDLMWTLLHIDGFSYTDQLRQYYDCFRESDDFEMGFVNNAFRLAVGELVIALHDGDRERAKSAHQAAMAMAEPSYVSRVQPLLDRHRAKDRLLATPESLAFLEKQHI
ncbi:MAG: hypothetical protein IKO22_07055 [Oscillospiraceae bacterium]|nr:hypothetical protein [Oscillospiraceae bacterium]